MNFIVDFIWLVRGLFFTQEFEIRKGYKHRKKSIHFSDLKNKDEYQDEVYCFARKIFKEENYTSLVDIGCGSAFKLFKYFDNKEFTGVEIEPTLSSLKNKHQNSSFISWEELKGHFNLIICADVIEHIENPYSFLERINQLSWDKLIISTPDRNLLPGITRQFGPPKNIHHTREWTSSEFNNLLKKYFSIEEHFISNKHQGTQVIMASKKGNEK